MNISRRVTGALAWAGLVIVIAVPSAEFVSSKVLSLIPGGAKAAPSTAAVKPATAKPMPKPAAVAVVAPVAAKPAPAAAPAPVVATAAPQAAPKPQTPAPQPAKIAETTSAPSASDGNAVGDYLATNKTLPSYISTTPAAKPTASAAPATAATAPATQQASAAPQTPAAQRLAASLATADANADPAPQQTPEATASVTAPTAPPHPLPVASRPKRQPNQVVTEADLKDWTSGTLEDYLKAHGLLTSADQSNGN